MRRRDQGIEDVNMRGDQLKADTFRMILDDYKEHRATGRPMRKQYAGDVLLSPLSWFERTMIVAILALFLGLALLVALQS
jgi:hypothetical protein